MSDTVRTETLIEDYNKMVKEIQLLKDREKKLVAVVRDFLSTRSCTEHAIGKCPVESEPLYLRASEVLKELGEVQSD